ncbi:hypothetical protein ACROYT_G035271 [Oculina patagonica]
MEYSPEQLSYFRICYVAFNLVPEGLRKIFRQEWNFRYTATSHGKWKEAPKNGLDFYNNEGKKSRSKNCRYLTTIQNGNTAEWDCSCLFFAILFSDSIGTTLSAVIRKEVDDLRQFRNDIAHICEAKLSDADFQNYMARVLQSFNSLGLPINDIENVRNQRSFPTAEVESLKKQVDDLKTELDQTKFDLETIKSDLCSAKEENSSLSEEVNSKLESFCSLALSPPHEIIRRSKDIQRITKKMEELCDCNIGAVSTIFLSGSPGCGKSQLAGQIGQEFFSTRSLSEDLTFVATLNAESIETLADSYLTLGKQLGITEYTLTALETSKREKPSETIQHLKRLILPKTQKFSRWLIIADNVHALSLVHGCLPQTGSTEWGHGLVLITTQDSTSIPPNSSHTYHESFSKGMQLNDALELLHQVSQTADQAKAEDVAKALEYQPLALAAAGYYVKTVVENGSPSFSWTEYLKGLRQGHREVSDHLLASQNLGYSKTMTTAVKMALERAVEADEVFHHLFFFLSLCSSELLPLEAAVKYVKARTTGQPEELIKARILKSSLILISAEEEEEVTFLRLHNIVHEVLKQEAICILDLTERTENMATAIKIFESFLQSEHENIERKGKTCALLRKLTSHCKALLAEITITSSDGIFQEEMMSFITVHKLIQWLCSFAIACNKISDLPQAKELFYKALAIQKKIFGEDHADVATSYNDLGAVYTDIGEYNQAKEFHAKALAIRKKIFGEEHAHVATSYSNLGEVHRNIGEYNEAKELYEKALKINKSIFGDENADIAASYSNLGLAYADIGDYHKARKLHERALMIRKKIFGEEHADVATIYNNLGAVYTNIGEYNKAKELHEKALLIRTKIFGEEHADVATSYNNLALVYQDIGEYDQAKELLEKALTICRKIFGEEHAHVAICYSNLGQLYANIGEYNQAKEVFEKALMIYQTIFGEVHTHVATSYKDLGAVHCNIGEYNQAKELYGKALMTFKQIFGEEHDDVATSYNNLALVYQDIGEYDQAKKLLEKALSICKKIYGEEHANAAICYSNLGQLYANTGEYNQAIELLEKALMIYKRIFGEVHIHVATSYKDLGAVHCNIGEYNQAKELYGKALMITKQIFGEEHDDVATIYNNLGAVYDSIGNHNQAEELYQKAMAIKRKIYVEDKAAVATGSTNISRPLKLCCCVLF